MFSYQNWSVVCLSAFPPQVFPDTVASGEVMWKPSDFPPPTSIPEWKLHGEVAPGDNGAGADVQWTVDAAAQSAAKDLARAGLPVTVESSLTLSGLTKAWAEENEQELVGALRTTLKLSPSEQLRITSISEVETRRKLAVDENVHYNTGVFVNGRALQTVSTSSAATKVLLNFLVGFASKDRAAFASTQIAKVSFRPKAKAARSLEAKPTNHQFFGWLRLRKDRAAFVSTQIAKVSFVDCGITEERKSSRHTHQLLSRTAQHTLPHDEHDTLRLLHRDDLLLSENPPSICLIFCIFLSQVMAGDTIVGTLHFPLR